MLDEYVLIPDIFDPAAYSNAALIGAYLPFLKEPLLQEALVRDLCDGGWRRYCIKNSGQLHPLCKEILKKLAQNNRLHCVPNYVVGNPQCAADWCQEGLSGLAADPFTGIIAGHNTKNSFAGAEVASIEKLTSTPWWQKRSPSVTVDRKTADYLRVLRLVQMQANSLMFIDPNLDPSSYNYREFIKLLLPLAQRAVKPRIEIHRSLCKGDGPARTFPTLADWQENFATLGRALKIHGLFANVFCWDDFHERYLITDIIGISVPAGFDVTGRSNDFSTWGRLGRLDKDKIQRLFDPAARQPKWHFEIGN